MSHERTGIRRKSDKRPAETLETPGDLSSRRIATPREVAERRPCSCSTCKHDTVGQCNKKKCYCCGRMGFCGQTGYWHYAEFEKLALEVVEPQKITMEARA
jgi:hypothetical protein